MGSPQKSFNDSNIIDGSFTVVKMKNADEIFQDYNIKYDYYPPSEVSDVLPEYLGSIEINESKNDLTDSEISKYLEWSRTLYQNENAYEANLEYIYKEEDAERITSYIVKWFSLNAWEVSFKVSISNIFNNSTLEYMDYVSLNSNFFTNNEIIYGFITSVFTNIYDGTVTISMYIPRPPGVFGPYSDFINDALNASSRDISGWTDDNGRQNDSGRASTRTIGNYTVKDAGKASTRDFND